MTTLAFKLTHNAPTAKHYDIYRDGELRYTTRLYNTARGWFWKVYTVGEVPRPMTPSKLIVRHVNEILKELE